MCWFGLLGFNMAFKHLISRRCILLAIDECAATHERHATDTGHDTPPGHSIHTQGRPLVAVSIDVERRVTTTQFNVLGQTRSGNHSPTFHTYKRTLNLMILVCYECVRWRVCVRKNCIYIFSTRSSLI